MLFFYIMGIFLFSYSSYSQDVNLNDYEYVSIINVNCEEYIGWSRFPVPKEYEIFDRVNSYMNNTNRYFIDSSKTHLIKNNNWYIKTIDGINIEDVEKIYDNNYGTYMVSELNNSISLKFENPNLNKVDKINLDIKDSAIENISVYDSSGNNIQFKLITEGFHYEIMPLESIYDNNIHIVIGYDEIIKIREISFYEEKKDSDDDYVYFYIDNNCADTFYFYFGNYGENKMSYSTDITLPVEFSINVETQKNILYNNDFDNDGIINSQDNCPRLENNDQKDINYNNIGDACEDFDNDGILNFNDNCIDDRNYQQTDVDGDGIGDVCDTDDERFFQKNNYIIYILMVFIMLLFGFLTYKILKK